METMRGDIRVAICGNLPTAYQCLLENGVVKIDQYSDATEIPGEAQYHLLLIYAPQAEGLLGTHCMRSDPSGQGKRTIPIRLLGEPCCHSAQVELRSTIRRIGRMLDEERGGS